jgi:hypothetical protein
MSCAGAGTPHFSLTPKGAEGICTLCVYEIIPWHEARGILQQLYIPGKILDYQTLARKVCHGSIISLSSLHCFSGDFFSQ